MPARFRKGSPYRQERNKPAQPTQRAVKPVEPPHRVMPNNQPPARLKVAYHRPVTPSDSALNNALSSLESARDKGYHLLKMVGRARSGDYAQDRAIQIDEVESERIRAVPQQCSNCGAALTTPILRGQTEITCEYSGVKTRILKGHGM